MTTTVRHRRASTLARPTAVATVDSLSQSANYGTNIGETALQKAAA
ncbi:hypothetical protein ACFQH2_16660 [Natronoarchaeum sp. GCM10025703]